MLRRIVTVCAMSALALGATAQEKPKVETPELESFEQKMSYSLGHGYGEQLKDIADDLDVETLIAGIRAAMADQESALSQEETQTIMREFTQRMQKRQQEKAAMAGAENAEAGAAFLEQNGKRDGVKTTDSGLQYEVIKEGDGPTPKASDAVSVHYTGTLIDGTKFDSSVDRGEPIQLPYIEQGGRGSVIDGWVEALQMMPVGSKWKLYIPSNLAYGSRGAGQAIGPNSTLIFDVELISIDSDPSEPVVNVQ